MKSTALLLAAVLMTVFRRRRPWGPGALGVLFVLAVALAALPPAAAAPEALDLSGSAFVFASEPGDYIGAGQTRWFTPSDSTFGSSFDGNHFEASIDPPTGFWYVQMSAPPNTSLVPGVYENALRYPFNGNQPGLSIYGDGRGCNTLSGRYIVATANQSPLSFEASFEQHCEGGDAALVGQIRIGPAGTDTLGPSLATPGYVSVEAETPTQVSYSVSAVDLGDPNPTVECAPASGSVFPLGATTVTCTATDASNNETTRSFLVRVRTGHPLSLTLSKTTINFGSSIVVKAHLSPFQDTSNPVVSIYKTPYGGSTTLVAQAPVNPSGDLAVTLKPARHTDFVAEWEGDADYPDAAVTRHVQVRVITKARISGAYAISGRYKLFHYGHSVTQTGTVLPNHAGRYLKFVAQRYSAGAWRAAASGSFRIRSNGSVTAYFRGSRGTYRARNVFASDFDHLGDASPWRYFKIT